MRVGLSSAVFYPQRAEVAVEKLVSMGFPCAEYFYNCDSEISNTFLNMIKNLLSGGKSSLVSVHPYTAFAESVFFFSGYERRVEEQLVKYGQVFRSIKDVGGKYFTFHGDRTYDGIADEYCKFEERDKSVIQKLCDSAEKAGITLCLENVSWCKSANINYIKKISDEVDNIGFTLDLKQARRAGVDWNRYLEVMATKLKNIHISDFNAESDCLLPGEGKFDFSRFFSRLNDFGYKGDVIIEVYSSNYKDESQILKSKKFLEDILG